MNPPLSLEQAAARTADLLREWADAAGAVVVIDRAALWILCLRAELRRPAVDGEDEIRRAALSRLLADFEAGLQPRLRQALHRCLRGRVFSLRLRSRPVHRAWRVPLEPCGPEGAADSAMQSRSSARPGRFTARIVIE